MRTDYSKKAQSAMEYLMTYGWAILIIAVVLGALFSLGVFSGSSLLGNACIASAGYFCSNPVYFHGTVGTYPAGNVLVTVGQNTGVTWTSVNVVFVPQGTGLGTVGASAGLPNVNFVQYPTGVANVIGFAASPPAGTGLVSGQQQQVTLPVSGLIGTVAVGTAATGAIWAQYTISATGASVHYTQLATINIKAS